MMTDDMLREIRGQLAERDRRRRHQQKTDVVMLEAQLLGIEELATEYLASVEFSGMIREEPSAGPAPFREVWNMVKPRTAARAGWWRASRRSSEPGGAAPRIINNRGMTTPASPASFFDQLFERVGQALQPPPWVVQEMQRRLVLLLNHVLQQEPEAQARLKRQTGRLVEAHWRHFSVRLVATPAGLLDLGPATQAAGPDPHADRGFPFSLAQAALRGDKPPVRIAGDVQLAAEVQWLVDHVRWDIEEDLAACSATRRRTPSAACCAAWATRCGSSPGATRGRPGRAGAPAPPAPGQAGG